MGIIRWEHLAIAVPLATYVISVVDAARTVSRRRIWNTPPARRPVTPIKR